MADVKKTTKAKAPVKKAEEVKTLAQLQEELVNPHVITVQRKNIARAKTLIRQAELAAVKEEN